MKTKKKIEKLDISYYETDWYEVCRILEDKLNEIIDYLNKEE